MQSNQTFTKVLLTLVIIGAINWGLIGFFNWSLVDAIFGGASRPVTSTGSRIIYSLVGLAGVALIPMLLSRGRETVTAAPKRREVHA